MNKSRVRFPRRIITHDCLLKLDEECQIKHRDTGTQFTGEGPGPPIKLLSSIIYFHSVSAYLPIPIPRHMAEECHSPYQTDWCPKKTIFQSAINPSASCKCMADRADGGCCCPEIRRGSHAVPRSDPVIEGLRTVLKFYCLMYCITCTSLFLIFAINLRLKCPVQSRHLPTLISLCIYTHILLFYLYFTLV